MSDTASKQPSLQTQKATWSSLQTSKYKTTRLKIRFTLRFEFVVILNRKE